MNDIQINCYLQGATAALGHQLYRRFHLDDFCLWNILKDPDKLRQWRGFLIRTAFATGSDGLLGVRQNAADQKKSKSSESKNDKKSPEATADDQVKEASFNYYFLFLIFEHFNQVKQGS